MKRIIIWILGIGLIIGIAIGLSQYYKGHRDIQSEKPVYTGHPDELYSQLLDDPVAFSETFTLKAVVLEGYVTSVDETVFTLENTFICRTAEGVDLSQFSTGEHYTIKGRIVGYEEDLIEGYIVRVDGVVAL